MSAIFMNAQAGKRARHNYTTCLEEILPSNSMTVFKKKKMFSPCNDNGFCSVLAEAGYFICRQNSQEQYLPNKNQYLAFMRSAL